MNIEKNKYTLIQKHFLSCSHSFHALHSPVSFLSVSFHFLPCSFYFRQSYLCFTFTLFNFPPFLWFFQFLSCPSDVPLVSLSVRLIFLLIFLSCPFHFTLLSLQFPSLFPSSHFSFFLYVLSFFKIISNFRPLCSWSLVLFILEATFPYSENLRIPCFHRTPGLGFGMLL